MRFFTGETRNVTELSLQRKRNQKPWLFSLVFWPWLWGCSMWMSDVYQYPYCFWANGQGLFDENSRGLLLHPWSSVFGIFRIAKPLKQRKQSWGYSHKLSYFHWSLWNKASLLFSLVWCCEEIKLPCDLRFLEVTVLYFWWAADLFENKSNTFKLIEKNGRL